jgi:predicted RNA-binding protein YlxR (DUF448 family)
MRVVRTPEGGVEVDHSGRAAGRGAYVCRAAECVEIAVRKQALRRALGQALPEHAAERLRLAAAQAGAGGGPPVPEQARAS